MRGADSRNRLAVVRASGFLAVKIDLFWRRVIGCSMQSRITSDLALDALLMAVWRRKPTSKVLVHSGQGGQYTSYDWGARSYAQTVLKAV